MATLTDDFIYKTLGLPSNNNWRFTGVINKKGRADLTPSLVFDD
jgi:hypothetical protein